MGDHDDTISFNIGCWPPLAAFAVFLTLKLSGVVDWPWWIVTAPIWIFPAIVAAFIAAIFVLVALMIIAALPVVLYRELRK